MLYIAGFFGTIVVGEIFAYYLFGFLGIVGLHILSLFIVFLLSKYSCSEVKGEIPEDIKIHISK